MFDINLSFAENLRLRRCELGFTQAQLARAINYTEKSISKWESGGAIPPVKTLLALADALKTDVQSLISAPNDEKFYLGIDGGADGTQFSICDRDGKILRSIHLASSNPFDVGMEKSQQILDKGIRELTYGIPYNKICLFAGISGAGIANNISIYRSFFKSFGFYRFDCDNDTKNAVRLGLSNSNGIVAVIGTGSVVCLVNGDTVRQIGGHGYLFDRGLSSYEIGAFAVAHSFSVSDGIEEPDELSEKTVLKAGGSLDNCIVDFYGNSKTYIASFAPIVFESAKSGTPSAINIIKNSALALRDICIKAATTLPPQNRKVVLVGELTKYKSELNDYFKPDKNSKTQFEFCEKPQINGALLLAKDLDSPV